MERLFERRFIKDLERMFPGCITIKLNAGQIQGIPDRLFLYGSFWATLEFKDSATAARQPNQMWYVEKMNEMSFSAFVYPENAEDVLNGLQQAYEAHRAAFLP